VAELERSLTSSELTDWMAYYRLEPWGAWRDNFHAALIAAVTANKGARQPVALEDFYYRDEDEASEREAQRLKSMFDLLAQPKEPDHG